MSGLSSFSHLLTSIRQHTEEWRTVFDDENPHRATFPAPYGDDVTGLQRLCLIRMLRRDKVMDAIMDFVVNELGQSFVEPPPFDLKACYNDSAPCTPLIFVLSTGSDPAKDLYSLAQDMNTQVLAIALGQGQGKKASAMVEKGITTGKFAVCRMLFMRCAHAHDFSVRYPPLLSFWDTSTHPLH